MENLLNYNAFSTDIMRQEPYRWGFAQNVFSADYSEDMVAGFPVDNFKEVAGYDGEKDYLYRARSLVHMGADEITNRDRLSACWQRFGDEVISAEFREMFGALIQRDLAEALLEVNVTEYSAGAHLGPHLDLKEKIATAVFYFNADWSVSQGGALHILGSKNIEDAAAVIPPIIGNVAILVRSDRSWHAVPELRENVVSSRRSVNVIFHQPGAKSTMW
ncbi:MAG TPA: 2OG-Fe(II) oxygenase [Spongiibacteraceae bacterium]|nr:2OG-Fe(II) oxygenase [Spongiibacteraceae bacterium]